jgi:hypothetical protein
MSVAVEADADFTLKCSSVRGITTGHRESDPKIGWPAVLDEGGADGPK